ncbi:MAG: STAS domain-containing protein [Acidimicrobiales bacterium]
MSRLPDQQSLSVRIADDGEPTVIRVEGELDSFTAAELREGFGRAMQVPTTDGAPATVVDIREVPFVDSAGLGALVGGIRRLRQAGGHVALCCTRPSVLRLLNMTGFDRIVTVTSSPEEARQVLSPA